VIPLARNRQANNKTKKAIGFTVGFYCRDKSFLPLTRNNRLSPVPPFRLVAASLEYSGVVIAAHQFFHEVHLDLLNLQKFLPLVLEQDVEFLMQMTDLKFGL